MSVNGPPTGGGDGEVDLPSRILIVVPTLGRRIELLEQALRSIVDQPGERADIVMVVPSEAAEARACGLAAGAKICDDPGGLSAAINLGLAQACPNHTYGSWLNDDDLLAPGALQIATKALDNAPRAVLVFGYCDYIDELGRKIFTSRVGRLAPWLMTWGPDLVPQPGSMFRLEAFSRVGGLDTSLEFAMDLDLFLRMRRLGRILNTGRKLGAFRWHSTSMTVASRSRSLDESAEVKRRYLTPCIRLAAPLWEGPVRVATRIAAWRANSLSD